MSDYPRGFQSRLFRSCRSPLSDPLAIPPALCVPFVFSCGRCSIGPLGLPSRPSARRLPALIAAIALSLPLWAKPPLASLQQTATCPRAPAWCLAGFPTFARKCRILVRAHGSVAPGSSCPGEDLTPLQGAASPVQRKLKSLSQSRPVGLDVFSLAPCARGWCVLPAGAVGAINPWRPGPFWRCHNGPFARRHQQKGKHSVGVTRQYCGEVGKQENCRVAVSLSVATWSSSLPVDYRLYLPKEWAEDTERREKTEIPADVGF